MTAAPASNNRIGDISPHLSLVEDPGVTFTYSLDHFQPEKYSDGTLAMSIGRLVTEAGAAYRLNMGGKHGYELDAERLTQRRNFAYSIFREFGMLQSVVELSDNKASEEQLEQVQTEFAKDYYDPADKTIADLPRSEINDLIEKRMGHPVIRTANSLARISGESNSNMRTDAILVTRAAALILEKIEEAEYPEKVEL